MALPVQKVPEYFCELPLTGLEVKFRPFLVAEQKSLLLLQESDDKKEVFNALTSLIKAVTFGELQDISFLPIADLEYLFLQIRMKSVGETVDLNLICRQEDCNAQTPVKLDLNDVQLDTLNLPDNKIQLSEDLGVVMRWPTAELQKAESKNDNETFMNVLMNSIDTIYDAEEVYDLKDYADRELEEFINSLTVQQIEKMGEFLQDAPTLSHNLDWKCQKCKSSNGIELKGLENFF